MTQSVPATFKSEAEQGHGSGERGRKKNKLPNKRHGKLPKGEVASLFFTEAYKTATIRALRVFCHFFSVYLCIIELIEIETNPFLKNK